MAGFFEKVDKIRPVFDIVYKIVLFICKILLVADILITSMAVLGRYVPFIPDPAWSEEIVLTLMAYMAVLSASLAIRRGAHIRMTAFDQYLHENVKLVLDILADIMVLILAVIMIKVGWEYASGLGAKATYISLPKLSKFWQYFPIPVAGVAMLVFEIEILYSHLKAVCGIKDNSETEKEEK